MRPGGERGVALALAVFAIALSGLLVAAVFAGALREQRAGEYAVYSQQALEAAESSLVRAMAEWDQAGLGALAVGQDRALATEAAGRNRARATVTRLNGQLYLIAGLGERMDGADSILARRKLGIVVRVDSASGAVRPITGRSWAQLYN